MNLEKRVAELEAIVQHQKEINKRFIESLNLTDQRQERIGDKLKEIIQNHNSMVDDVKEVLL